jgi:putative NIF3 family GTP cyclohydrolase 1 type 2
MTAWLAKALGPGEVSPIVPVEPGSAQGSGRHVVLERPVTLQEAVVLIKAHLGLSQLRLSRAFTDQMVTTFAVCPGAGGSVFEKLGHVDLLLTGEMRHHDVLSRKENGTHVILTDHTNTERGYLPHFADDLRRLCPGLRVEVSTTDADPLLPL